MTAVESYLPDVEAYQPKANRKHIFFAVLAVLGIFLALTLIYPKNVPVMPKDSQVTVQPKETLWDIVGEEYPNSVNPWDAVDAIEKVNGLKSAGDLQAEHTYYLPVIN